MNSKDKHPQEDKTELFAEDLSAAKETLVAKHPVKKEYDGARVSRILRFTFYIP